MIEKNDKLVKILIAVIAVLLVVVLYAFVISPKINGYVVSGQNQGIQYAIMNIAQQASSCQPVPLNLGQDENGQNQTMNLIAAECFQDRFPELFSKQGSGQEIPTQ